MRREVLKSFVRGPIAFGAILLALSAIVASFVAHDALTAAVPSLDYDIATTRTPLVLINGKATPLPAADSISSPGGISVGSVTNTGQQVHNATITPTAFAGTRVDDYNPTGLATAYVISQDASSDTILTGIAAQPTGTLLTIRNIATTSVITLASASAFSAAANRFSTGGNAWTMPPQSAITLAYSGTNWNLRSTITTEFPTATVDGSLYMTNGASKGLIYLTGNELDNGYSSNFVSTGYTNYGGYLNGSTQFRDWCMSNGKGATGASCLMYFHGSDSRVGMGTAAPAKTLDVVGSVQASVNFNTTAGTITAGSTGDKFTADPTNNAASFTGMKVAFGNMTTAACPIDITESIAGSTSEVPMAIQQVTSGATFDTTAQNRRAYSNFWDASPTISAGANILTGIQLRMSENMGGHATSGGTIHPVALWLDEGETWIGEHIMQVVRPGHIAIPTVSACGTTPNGIGNGNDNRGRVTVGGGAVVSCTLTFTIPWVNSLNTSITPTCLVQAENGAVLAYAATTTSLVITGTLTGQFLNYDCNGTDNAVVGP